ncbi:MAG: N-acetyltransferase [Burkholderiales bacterium]|nr:N-acetyltransferase [Burkholderiales bacterium]
MHYRTQISKLSAIGQAAWDNLLAQQSDSTPFLSYAFLQALHETGCATAETGWQEHYLSVWQDDLAGKSRLVAALPLYLKMHSYGEYVFDWAWAEAYQRHGLEYYPKLLSSIPFTPVAGNRLLAVDAAARAALLQALAQLRQEPGISSTHVLFPTQVESELLRESGMMIRQAVQFHWQNRGFQDFAHFLASLEQKKRKNIAAERRKVAQAGVTLERILGAQVSLTQWRFFAACYAHTYKAHFSTPYLNLDFFLQLAQTMPDNLLLIIASKEGKNIASALVVYDEQTLYGRYWGCLQDLPCLHFETAYYQPLEFCIERQLQSFEGGAQGEHKMARGFLPHTTYSAHHLQHPSFANAVEHFLAREQCNVSEYVQHLEGRNPFRVAAIATS